MPDAPRPNTDKTASLLQEAGAGPQGGPPPEAPPAGPPPAGPPPGGPEAGVPGEEAMPGGPQMGGGPMAGGPQPGPPRGGAPTPIQVEGQNIRATGEEGSQYTGTVGGEMPGSEEATAEEQAAYEQVVIAGQKILFEDPNTKRGIVNMLKAGAQDPTDAIASAAVHIIGQLDTMSQGTIPEVVILPAAAAMVEEIAEISNAHTQLPEIDHKMLNQATQKMVVKLAEEYGTDPTEIQAALDTVPPEQMDAIMKEQGQYHNG